jgi:hypothetical protein
MSQLPNHVPNFSNAQLEILKAFAGNLSEEETLQMRDVLFRFKAELFRKKIDRFCEEQGYTNETMEAWLNDENQ